MSRTTPPRVVALDADDTLWQCETAFVVSTERFRDLVLRHVDMDKGEIDARLSATERRNLKFFGYGVKGFTLSMVETAIEVTGGRIPATDLHAIIGLGREMLAHPIELLPGAAEVPRHLRDQGHEVWLITKGDLFDQESKVARSGLADLFHKVEIVSEKNAASYARLLDRHGVKVLDFAMAGNSLRSDVFPVAAIGALGIHVPHDLTWAHEMDVEGQNARWLEIPTLHELPPALSGSAGIWKSR